MSQFLLLAREGGDDLVFVHFVETIEQFTRDAFQLRFLVVRQRRPEILQALMLRRQQLTQELIPFFSEMQMEAATIVITLATLDPAAFLQFIGDARGVGA